MDFDATSLYPSAMRDYNSKYPRIETGYVFTKGMNKVLVDKFKSSNFTRGKALFIVKYYNPKNSIIQHLHDKAKINKLEVNRMRNGYIVDYLTSFDIQRIV